MLLVWDNLTGHETAAMVVWLCRHGIMPLYTPLGGSWLNMAESIQRILKRRTLDGQHPRSPAEIGAWFQQTAEAWNRQPTPFLWNGKRRLLGGGAEAVGHLLHGQAEGEPPLAQPCRDVLVDLLRADASAPRRSRVSRPDGFHW